VAAINRYLKRKIGGVQSRFSAVLPDAPQARERWLTRDEAAKLIMTDGVSGATAAFRESPAAIPPSTSPATS
jgi:hypothetical protein